MKRKWIGAVLAISLLANAVLGILVYRAHTDAPEEQEFLREISFAIQRFEGYQKEPDDGEYTVGVAHLYCAWSALGRLDEKARTYRQPDDFHTLWNRAAGSPEAFAENLDAVLEVLRQIYADKDFRDADALRALEELNAEMGAAAAEAAAG